MSSVHELHDPGEGRTPVIEEILTAASLTSAGHPRPSGPVIVCDNLVRIYKVADLEVVALQGLDLIVEPGEMIAIVGAPAAASRRSSTSSAGSTARRPAGPRSRATTSAGWAAGPGPDIGATSSV